MIKEFENKVDQTESAKTSERIEPVITVNAKGKSFKTSEPRDDSIVLPLLYHRIRFKMVGKDDVLCGKVLWKHKSSSAHKNIVCIKLDNGQETQIDFSNHVEEWKDVNQVEEEMNDPCCFYSFSNNKDIQHDIYATVLTKKQIKERPEAGQAMKDEIRKFENFEAFRRVKDSGQYAIKARWVVTEHEDESKGYKLKTRLCMRGDREQNRENIRVDSPTAHKDSLKLVLAIAANEEFDIATGDIKSAFLQGKSLDRQVFVVPPQEAEEEGVLWLLQKGAYGLIDGSRLFYLELKDKLERVGMIVLSGDPAIFTKHEDGKLTGMVCIHVDDILMTGNEIF